MDDWLDGALRDLPDPAMPAGLLTRVQTRLAAARRREARWRLGAGFAVVLFSAPLAVWLLLSWLPALSPIAGSTLAGASVWLGRVAQSPLDGLLALLMDGGQEMQAVAAGTSGGLQMALAILAGLSLFALMRMMPRTDFERGM